MFAQRLQLSVNFCQSGTRQLQPACKACCGPTLTPSNSLASLCQLGKKALCKDDCKQVCHYDYQDSTCNFYYHYTADRLGQDPLLKEAFPFS